ncbi:sulfotransferase [Aquisalimonas asiatica]|nr:sulfotransferase [Aquisalimonas asiatica]
MGGRPRVVLHIGLHKTGTRYLQREVFRPLDPTRYSVNPEPLWPAIRDAVRRPGDGVAAGKARAAVHRWRQSADSRTLVISEPHISGDMYGNHHDFADNLALMGELFPEARIIYFVRNQADWLQSAYRQQLVKGAGIPLHVFLNHYEGRFCARPGRWVRGGRTVEALNQRFLAVYRGYADVFGPERVALFRQEDLKRRPGDVKSQLAAVLGLDALPHPQRERLQNRSYSALAIRLFHPGTNRTLPPPTATDAATPRRRLRRAFRPLFRLRRLLIQHVFDRLLYLDWDLLAHDRMRERLDAHYADENRELARIAADVLRRPHPGRADGHLEGDADGWELAVDDMRNVR